MSTTEKKLKICKQGHKFYKSSDCPVCPQCESAKNASGFVAGLSAPARRALENAGITTIHQLAKYSEKDILELHGIGPSSLPKLRSALAEKHLSFRVTITKR